MVNRVLRPVTMDLHRNGEEDIEFEVENGEREKEKVGERVRNEKGGWNGEREGGR